MNSTALILFVGTLYFPKLTAAPSPISTIKISSPAFTATQVCALPGEGKGDLDPQIRALSASSSGKGLSAVAKFETAVFMTKSCTKGTLNETKTIKKKIIMTPKIFQILLNAPYFGIVNILK